MKRSNNYKKVNNKLICHAYYEHIDVINENGEIIDRYEGCFRKVIGYGNLIWYEKNNIIISDSNGRRNIKLNTNMLYDMTTDGRYIYILSDSKIIKYNTGGEYIKEWDLDSKLYFGKIIVDHDEIYVLKYSTNVINVYSNNGTFIRKIINDCLIVQFDVHESYVYVINLSVIKVFTKEGKLIYDKKHDIGGIFYNLLVIDDTMYVDADKIMIYKIKFY